MIIDGRKISQHIIKELQHDIAQLHFQPVFCDILVGNDPVSASYVNIKARVAQRAGVVFHKANYPANISSSELFQEIKKLNEFPRMCGLIVQLPLPPNLPRQEILDAIDPAIDVDCMGKVNLENFYGGRQYVAPPTAAGILKILMTLPIDLASKKILVLGQGELVGRPVAYLLKQQGFQVSVADKLTANTPELLKQADVIISATGKTGVIRGEKIKPGCVVIDAGTSEFNGSIVGDADLETVSKVASYVTPVPGGVGPVTVAMLINNVVCAAKTKYSQV